MKKALIILLIILAAGRVNGQYVYNDITASYGVITTDQVIDVFKDIIIATFSFGAYTKDNYQYSGALFLTYKYAPSFRFNVGATLGMDRVNGDLISNDIKTGEFRTSHTTLAVEMDYRYVKNEIFQMYSGLGIGYTLSIDSGTTNEGLEDSYAYGHTNMQLTLLGMRLGKKFAVFGEAGFGYKGLINFGLSYNF